MSNVKKVFVLLLIVAIVSLGLSLTGCKKKTETPPETPPAGEVAPDEHPAGEHPAGEKEHPAGEKPAGEHPEHPAKE